MGVVGHRVQSGLAVVKEVSPEGDDANVDEHDGGGKDVGGALQGDGEQSFGLVEGFWHVGCLTTNARVFSPTLLRISSGSHFRFSFIISPSVQCQIVKQVVMYFL